MRNNTPTNIQVARLFLPVITCALVLGSVAIGGSTHGSAPARTEDRRAEDVESILQDLIEDTEPGIVRACEELPLETVKFFIEFNETDEDIGVQTVLGGEPYKWLKAYGPNERKILDLRTRRSLRTQGLSDFFFESAEPALDEVSMQEFLDRFPEGEYEFETRTIDGLEQEGETLFTHMIPAGPEITAPLEGDVVDPDSVVITWEPVTMTTAFNPPQVPVTITGYQVILTREDPLRIFSADVSAETTSLIIPPGYLDPGVEYELEILAVEESDNQTISLLFFETEED